jgi:hypothetical protein
MGSIRCSFQDKVCKRGLLRTVLATRQEVKAQVCTKSASHCKYGGGTFMASAGGSEDWQARWSKYVVADVAIRSDIGCAVWHAELTL